MSINNFYNLIQSEQPSNFFQQSGSSMPLPVKTMRFPSLFMSHSEKKLFNNGFSPLSNSAVNQKGLKSKASKSNSNGSGTKQEAKYSWEEQEKEIFEQYHLLIQEDPLNLIHNNFQFAQLSKIISQYMKSSYEKAQKSLMKIVDKLRVKVIQNRKKRYEKIRQKVIKKKYILTKEHDILQGVIFLRSNQENKLVGITRRMLQIYMNILAQNEIEAGEDMSELIQKREQIKKRNTDILSRKSMNKSVISYVSGSVQSQSQSSSSQYKGTKRK